MTAQTQVFLYNQRQWVVLLQQNLPYGDSRIYDKVYAKNLTIVRGVDNILEFAFINQNQKPVDISGVDITARILNADGTVILIQKTCSPIFPVTGLTSLRLSATDIEDINTQYCYYSLEIPVGAFDYPVFVDSQGGARGKIQIVNSVLPSFVESKTVTIPSHLPPVANGNASTYYSSTINTADASVLTVQAQLENFTGNVQFQASILQDFSFYCDITEQYQYTANSQTQGYNIGGFFPYVRMLIVNNGTYPPIGNTNALQGDVVLLLAR